jgi:Na+/citrate or Na+/malate symporter
LLDISIFGYGFVLSISILLYLSILNHSVQNLILIFLTAIILLFTWNLRNQLTKTMDFNLQRRNFLYWFVICLLFISISGIIVLIYPVSY